MNWLDKIVPSRISTSPETERKHSVPEGVWFKCENCETALYRPELIRNLEVCPNCGHHHTISARVRLEHFLDAQERREIARHLQPTDPLKFQDTKKYFDRLTEHQKNTGETEAMIVMQGRLRGLGVVACAFEPKFIGGSMGTVVGEKFVRGVQASIDQGLPFVCFANSGGARMQEGLYSLMQMAKTSAALAKLAEQQLPFISVLTNPTTGGVSASLAMLGDILIAEPMALIGFAGPRVIKDTVGQTLPEGFQRSEFLLQKGAIDLIVDRRHLNERIYKILSLLMHR